MEFLELCNRLAVLAKPARADLRPATSLDDRFADLGIDSLDGAVIVMYVSEIFGIDEASSRQMRPASVRELFEQVLRFKTREPESLEAAVAAVQ